MGNGITRAFNWMGVTFAEQGVAAFVSVRRHNLLPYTCLMLHWVGRGSFLLQTWSSQSHSTEFSLTSQLMGNLWRHRGAAQEKKSIRVINRPTCAPRPVFEDILDYQLHTNVNRTMNQFKWIFMPPPPDLSALCSCVEDKTEKPACDYKSSFSSVIKLQGDASLHHLKVKDL